MRSIFAVALALVATVVLTFAPAAHARVVGSGHVVTETRAVSGFDAIATSGSMDLVIRQGAKEGLEISADDNVVPLIETVVEGRTLQIRMKPGEHISTHGATKITVDVVQLKAVASSGSGDVAIDGLKTPALKLTLSGSSDAKVKSLTTDAFELRISGSGDVVATGSAKQVKVDIAGSGDADIGGLVADDVTVRIAGSGDANVTANKSLDVSVAGSGDVRYGGSVTAVKMSAAGSGSINRR